MRSLTLQVAWLALLSGCASAYEPGQEPSAEDEQAEEAPLETDCRDEDRDGYWTGLRCDRLPLDCDDIDAARHPERAEVCDGIDNDCNNLTDDDPQVVACALSQGVCAGSTRRCKSGDSLPCSPEDYGPAYVFLEDGAATAAQCDGLDNDCDGQVDEGCPCQPGDTLACGIDEGLCRSGVQRCQGGQWGACEGSVKPDAEVCDGEDNDCDGEVDEELSAPLCPDQRGVCVGARARCLGGRGWSACALDEYGPEWSPPEDVDARCDGLDNDCDGSIDEGCQCRDGATRPCGEDRGLCRQGVQTCAAGRFGACEGGVEPQAEVCDGEDNDCDGRADEGLVAPLCPLQRGICAGAAQVCGGAQGWLPCVIPDSYGERYRPEEDPARFEGVCDELDNDCDGFIDEGCAP